MPLLTLENIQTQQRQTVISFYSNNEKHPPFYALANYWQEKINIEGNIYNNVEEYFHLCRFTHPDLKKLIQIKITEEKFTANECRIFCRKLYDLISNKDNTNSNKDNTKQNSTEKSAQNFYNYLLLNYKDDILSSSDVIVALGDDNSSDHMNSDGDVIWEKTNVYHTLIALLAKYQQSEHIQSLFDSIPQDKLFNDYTSHGLPELNIAIIEDTAGANYSDDVWGCGYTGEGKNKLGVLWGAVILFNHIQKQITTGNIDLTNVNLDNIINRYQDIPDWIQTFKLDNLPNLQNGNNSKLMKYCLAQANNIYTQSQNILKVMNRSNGKGNGNLLQSDEAKVLAASKGISITNEKTNFSLQENSASKQSTLGKIWQKFKNWLKKLFCCFSMQEDELTKTEAEAPASVNVLHQSYVEKQPATIQTNEYGASSSPKPF